MSSSHYADDKVFRTGNGSESFEVHPPRRGSSGFVVSIDSYDAPEASIRLSPTVAAALIEWMQSREADA